ncbi:hypothetical protein [Rufibacter hautae]|uniref:Glycosyltransferase RgtA/B/C/D-like domain-containing protein n=1 Tax=Rufibacter hautae TaxID=2595005 RepID=A0A5B6TAI2_9BACT|nr:hypothetical protein [Rufibacter hautae]KAA3436570.1 hypothetical protein FOA19_19480 [Rufibacter hautae]
MMRAFIRDNSFAIGFTLLYGILLAWLMQNHEMWFDETEPWLLALYSDTYGELLYNKRFEGHPNLWYSLLFIITKFTSNLKVLQVTQGIFAVSFVFVFLSFSPFPKVFRLLVCFGYYGLFEYGILSRLYAIELFFLFLVCTFYPKRFSHWYWYLTLLVLLAQTNLFGFFMAGVLGLLLFSEALRIWKDSPNWEAPSFLQITAGAIILAAGYLFSLWSMVRPNETNESAFTQFHPYYLYQAAARVWQAFVPVPNFTTTFWNTSYLPTRYEILLSAIILVILCGVFYRTKRLLLSLFLLFFASFCLFVLKMEGSMRHHAHFFFFTIAFLWIKTYYTQTGISPSIPFQQKLTPVFRALLVTAAFFQVIAGVYALALDWQHPFFVGKKVATFLRSLPPTYTLATDEGVVSSNITAYLGKPIYNLPKGNLKSFYTLDPNEVNDLRPYIILDWALALAQQRNTPVILVCRFELPYQWAFIPVEPMAIFRGDAITPFAFFVYKINPLTIAPKQMTAEYPSVKAE